MSPGCNPGYLRVSLLSACNLQCAYCRPHGDNGPAKVAPESNIRSAIGLLLDLGIRKVRFTGGEPTLYKGLSRMISYVKELDGGVHTAITSNGLLLESMAQDLSAAGLDSANISLDTLDRQKFRALAGHDSLEKVIAGIEAATTCINKVKLNCVLIRGFNDMEVQSLISFADDHGADIRFIEYMPNRFSAPGDSRFISGDEVRSRLPWNLQPLPGRASDAARYYSSASLRVRVGFITPVSHPFCDACDRIRLTADGMLFPCLFNTSAINLFELMTHGSDYVAFELQKLMRTKQSGSCQAKRIAERELPSFSTLGG